jgi:hypothetical protein
MMLLFLLSPWGLLYRARASGTATTFCAALTVRRARARERLSSLSVVVVVPVDL